MKWGKQKSTSTPISSSSSSTTSSHFHLISHVIPRSWLSKFKQTSEKTVLKNSPKEMRKPSSEKSSQSPSVKAPSQRPSGYYKDEDGFWRLGVGDENVGFAVQTPSCANCKTNVKEVATTTPKKMKKVMPKERVVVVKEGAKQEVLQRTYKKIMAVTKELHKELDEANAYRTQVESWRDLKDAKIREIMSKQQQQQRQQQRKSFHVSREPNNFKGRVRSPRTPLKTEMCKIRALEDMKRMKTMKKKAKQTAAEEAAAFGSFAVVKRSSDPQQDFKESMVEMILEKKIQRPEELEESLACYLTLNSEEYHDVIVKVFRQVWCELEQQSYFMNII